VNGSAGSHANALDDTATTVAVAPTVDWRRFAGGPRTERSRLRRRERNELSSVAGPGIPILWKIVCDFIPGSAAIDVGVKLGSNSRIIVEGSHANRYLSTVWPIAAKQARSAVYTKGFHCAFVPSVNFNQFCTLQQVKLLLPHACLRANRSSRVLAAAIAMTVTSPNERRINFKAHAAAQATAMDLLFHNRS
jgi:hypothetical protein